MTLAIASCDRHAGQPNDDDLIHMGHAILTFYSALIDLLGRCAPEMRVSVLLLQEALVVSVTTAKMLENEKMSQTLYKV